MSGSVNDSLIAAIKAKDLGQVEALLAAGADPDAKDGEGLSAYDWAVRRDHQSVLEVLHRFGITGNRIDVDENLIQAAETGDLDGLRESLAQGADVNARDRRQRTKDKTALMMATIAGQSTAVELLLAAGADPQLSDRGPEARPVPKHLVEHMGIETLIEMGYSLGRSALMSAAETGQKEIVNALLQAGSDPNHADELGHTPLALAAGKNNLEIVQTLVAAGAEIDRASLEGNTALILACEQGAMEVAQYLIDQGADIAKFNRERETALMKAAATGSTPVVQKLIEWGADVNGVSKERDTALGLAIGASHYVDVNGDEDEDEAGSISIIREYRDGRCRELRPLPEVQILELAQVLLQAGADPNPSGGYTTPLMQAARNGHLRVLQLLLNSGADLEVRNSHGDTAPSIAKLYDQQKVLVFLREYTGTDLSQYDRLEPMYRDEEDRWGEELPIPDFSVRAQDPGYQQAVRDLAEICGSTAVPDETLPGFYTVHVNTKRRMKISTGDLQQQFLEKGCFVYQPDYFHGSEGPEHLAVLPTTDKYEVIAVHQTNGCNCGIGPGYVVEWLRDLEERHPFILTCIAHDTLAGRFLEPIDNPETLAEEMYDFCPDIVDQGCESVEVLAESLASSDQVFFWWD